MYSDTAAGMMHDPASVKAPPKKVRSMTMHFHPKHVEVTHHHTHSAHPAESTTIPIHQGTGMDALHDHIEDHAGQPNDGEAECEDGNCE
jgi:hypothetical protein